MELKKNLALSRFKEDKDFRKNNISILKFIKIINILYKRFIILLVNKFFLGHFTR